MTDRGVSTTLNYVLAMSIALVMLIALVVSGTNFVAERNEQVSRTEMQVIAQRVAADVQTADRLVTAGGANPTVELRTTVPTDVVGSRYRVELRSVTSPTRQVVRVTSTDTDVSVSVRVPTDTPIEDGASASGGDILVRYDDSGPALVIDDA